MLVSEYTVINNIRVKLQQDRQDAFDMLMSTPVEKTYNLVSHKTTIGYIDTLLADLERYAKKLNDPYQDEENLTNYFTNGGK